jgi:hypothetical protein
MVLLVDNQTIVVVTGCYYWNIAIGVDVVSHCYLHNTSVLGYCCLKLVQLEAGMWVVYHFASP